MRYKISLNRSNDRTGMRGPAPLYGVASPERLDQTKNGSLPVRSQRGLIIRPAGKMPQI